MRLILASASPARLATLRAAGLDPEVIVSGVDESQFSHRDAGLLAKTLAVEKARAVAQLPEAQGADLVVGCDSLLDFEGQALGKPRDAQEAVARWYAMRGKSGELTTGHCLIDLSTGVEISEVATTTVHFGELSDTDVHLYVASGEPVHVAGAFTIDGLGGAFITRIDGDPHNVVGISLPLLRDMVQRLGRSWTDLWVISS